MFDGGNFELLFLDWSTYNESGPLKIFVPNLVKKFSSEKQKLLNKMISSDLYKERFTFWWPLFSSISLKLKYLQSSVRKSHFTVVVSEWLLFVLWSICFFLIFVATLYRLSLLITFSVYSYLQLSLLSR